ncbi:VOC family protein [Kutzneria sp. NPDC051319]|uniref:VOC family protein n=1 Tax=Kutzneria sp. NPDC051319 TaxID=3155047 RepID=UPI003424B751
MTSRLHHVTVDCADPYALATFWSAVIGYEPHPADSPGDEEVLLQAPGDGPGVLFIQVPEGKSAKNRLHFDLQPAGPRDEEVERLLALGATMVLDMRRPDGRGWAQLADPEGNEFCVERSAAERAALGDA